LKAVGVGGWGVPEEARLVIQTPMRRLMEGGGVAMGSPAAAAAIRNAVLGVIVQIPDMYFTKAPLFWIAISNGDPN
jgi:hypothetical protein